MMSTTREIVLKIKTEMSRGKSVDVKQFATDAGRMAKIQRDITPILNANAKAWEQYARAVSNAATAHQRLNAATGVTRQPTTSRPGGGGGSGGGGGFGLASLGRFAPHALAIGAGVAVLNEARSAVPHLWGAYLHGGPIRRGAFPMVEGFLDTVSGREQREMMEDLNQARIDRELRFKSSVNAANLGYRSGVHGLQRQMLSAAATPEDHMNLLARQRGELRTDLGELEWSGTKLRHEEQRKISALEAERRRLLQEHQERVEGNRALPLGLPHPDNVPWGVAALAGPLGLQLKASTKIGSMLGGVAGEVNVNKEYDDRIVQAQLEYAKKLAENAEAQKAVMEKILSNGQQQLEVAKSTATARQQGVIGYGKMTPTEQRVAVGAAQTLRRGGTISREEEQVLGQAGPHGQALLQEAYFKQGVAGGYGEFLQAAGAPSKEQEQYQQGVQSTALAQLALGSVGVNLPDVRVSLMINEEIMAKAIAKEIGDDLREARVIATQAAERVRRLEEVVSNNNTQRQASTTNRMGR